MGQGLGAALSPADLESIAGVLQDFAVRYLLPHLELRLRSLNQQACPRWMPWLALVHRMH